MKNKMKNIIFWGLLGCSTYYLIDNNNKTKEAMAEAKTQAIIQSEDSQWEETVAARQREESSRQAHIDALRIQYAIDDAAYKTQQAIEDAAFQAAFQARMAADRRESNSTEDYRNQY